MLCEKLPQNDAEIVAQLQTLGWCRTQKDVYLFLKGVSQMHQWNEQHFEKEYVRDVLKPFMERMVKGEIPEFSVRA